jgi:catechol 2,3-dioxygenase-like lactoylglutathione lyase family enzyme
MVSIGNITFACDDPDRLRDFWIAALGYVAVLHCDGDPEGNGFCVK